MYKCGGNTYLNKSEKEMERIKDKIRQTKIGGKNPNARSVKCKNVETNEEYYFNSMSEMQKFFNATDHQFISRRCLKKIRCLYKGKWAIAYADNDYDDKATVQKNNRKSTRILVTNLKTNETKEFPSYASAEREFGLRTKAISGKAYLKGEEFIYNNWLKIQVLN